jgi:hypothetical protein
MLIVGYIHEPNNMVVLSSFEQFHIIDSEVNQ